MKSKRFAGLLSLLLALFLPATAFAAENDDIVAIQWKKIAGEDFYIDELDGVKAYPQYQCNDFAIRYYQEVFDVDMFVGVTPPFLLRNLFSDETGFVLTDEPKKGDIAYWPMERRGLPYAHTAVVKSYEDGVLTLIEQNWNWNNSASYQRKVKFPSENYDVYTLAEEPAVQDKGTGKSTGLRLSSSKKSLKSDKKSDSAGSGKTISFQVSGSQDKPAPDGEVAAQEEEKPSPSKGKSLTLSKEKPASSGKKLTLKK